MAIIKEILRFIFGIIDGIAYEIISIIYNLFYELANMIMYDRQAFDALGKRIGLILGIVMLFRLAISLLSYIINPDKTKDNAKGAFSIIKNIGISLILLATINFIFEKAYILQKKVIETKIVEKIFFGEQATVTNVNIAYMLYTGFVTPNTDVIPGCENLFVPNIQVSETCSNNLSNANLSGEAKHVIQHDILQVHDFNNFFGEYSLINAKKNGAFVFNYTPIISTVSAIAIILILLTFCMDTATRMVKLMFYQIIAPIPIIANMMPGKGNEIFKKWVKECINTYLSVFLRIIALNFAVFMITLITVNHSDILENKSIFITVFIIIGCLMFAKQLPKLIEEIFGIKSDGMLLHPLKKFQEQALFGKNITSLGAAGLAGTAATGANMISRFRMGLREKGGARVWDMTLGTIASGVAGGISAATRGAVGAVRGQNFGQVYNGAYRGAVTARNNRNSRIDSKIMAPEVWANKLDRAMGVKTTFEVLENRISVYDEFTSSGDSAVSISESELDKYADKIYLAHFNNGTGVNARTISGREVTLNTLAELREAMTDNTQYDASQRAYLNAEYNKLRGDISEDIRTEIYNGSAATDRKYSYNVTDSTGRTVTKYIFDNDNASAVTIAGHMKYAEEIINENQNDPIFRGKTIDGKTIKSIAKKTKSESATTKISDDYKRAKKIHEQTNKEKK